MTNPTETPAAAATISEGDMQRLAEFAHLVTSAQDAMSDEIVNRLVLAMVNEGATAVPAAVVWTSEAEARVERVPSFIRPMTRRA